MAAMQRAGRAENAKPRACVPEWNRPSVPALPVRHMGQVRHSLKLQGRDRGRDRFMNEAPTESSAETGLPRRALAAARPFLRSEEHTSELQSRFGISYA